MRKISVVGLFFVLIAVAASAKASEIILSFSDLGAFVADDARGVWTIEGPLVAGGNVELNDSAVNTSEQASELALSAAIAANGDVALNQVAVRGHVYGRTISLVETVPTGGYAQGFFNDWAPTKALLTQLSSWLAEQPLAEVTMSWQRLNLTITVTDPKLNVVSIPAFLLPIARNINLVAPAGSYVVINVLGPQAFFYRTGVSLVGVDAAHMLWSFPDATRVTLVDSQLVGTVLAPSAAVDFHQASTVEGSLYATSMASHETVASTLLLRRFAGFNKLMSQMLEPEMQGWAKVVVPNLAGGLWSSLFISAANDFYVAPEGGEFSIRAFAPGAARNTGMLHARLYDAGFATSGSNPIMAFLEDAAAAPVEFADGLAPEWCPDCAFRQFTMMFGEMLADELVVYIDVINISTSALDPSTALPPWAFDAPQSVSTEAIVYDENFVPNIEQQPDVLYAVSGMPEDPVCQLSWVGVAP